MNLPAKQRKPNTKPVHKRDNVDKSLMGSQNSECRSSLRLVNLLILSSVLHDQMNRTFCLPVCVRMCVCVWSNDLRARNGRELLREISTFNVWILTDAISLSFAGSSSKLEFEDVCFYFDWHNVSRFFTVHVLIKLVQAGTSQQFRL